MAAPFRRPRRSAMVPLLAVVAAALLLVPAAGASRIDAAPAAKPKPSFLFAHTARSATFAPIPGRPRHYRLALAGAQRDALYFTDRPYRLAGALPLGRMRKALFHGPEPLLPNAAVSAVDPATGSQVLMGVELVGATYDWKRRAVVYTVKMLREGPAATRAKGRTDAVLPSRLAETTVFIDHCDDCASAFPGGYIPFDTSF